MISKKQIQAKIDHVLHTFDWDKTIKMMQVVDWKYVSFPGNERLVDYKDIIDTATRLLESMAFNEKIEAISVSSGGFKVYRYNLVDENDPTKLIDFDLELYFVGTSTSTMYSDVGIPDEPTTND